jgi:hypothetical protein
MTDRIAYENLPLGLTLIFVFLLLGIGIILYINKVTLWWLKMGLKLGIIYKFKLNPNDLTDADILDSWVNSIFYWVFIVLCRIFGGIFVAVSLYGLILILINRY